MHPITALALTSILWLHASAQQQQQPTLHWNSGKPEAWVPIPTGRQFINLQNLLGSKTTIDNALIYRIGDRWIIRVDSPARPAFLLLENEPSATPLRQLEYFNGLEKQLPAICRLFGWNDIEDPSDSIVYCQYPGEDDDDHGATMDSRIHTVETIDLHVRFLQQERDFIARYTLKNGELVLHEIALPQPSATAAHHTKEQPPTLHKENDEILIRHGKHTHSLTAALGNELRLYSVHIDRMDGQWIIRISARGYTRYFLLVQNHDGERMEPLEYFDDLNRKIFSILKIFNLENKLRHTGFRTFDANEGDTSDLLDPVVHETGSLDMIIDFRNEDYSIIAQYILKHGKLILNGLIMADNTYPLPSDEKE